MKIPLIFCSLFFVIVSTINGQILQDTVVDFDGNIYHTVKIGTQTWMVENLKVTHYRNGDLIPNITIDSVWYRAVNGSRCYYQNDSNTYAPVYGALYHWYTITDSRQLCPFGWHVPSDLEWSILINFLGGEKVAGSKMKEKGTIHWSKPNNNANNSSGFLALPGGERSGTIGKFINLGKNAYWWTGTEHNVGAENYSLTYNKRKTTKNISYKSYGFSIRCIKD